MVIDRLKCAARAPHWWTGAATRTPHSDLFPYKTTSPLLLPERVGFTVPRIRDTEKVPFHRQPDCPTSQARLAGWLAPSFTLGCQGAKGVKPHRPVCVCGCTVSDAQQRSTANGTGVALLTKHQTNPGCTIGQTRRLETARPDHAPEGPEDASHLT